MRKIYQYRNLARIIIETKTPLAVGSGEKDMITDQLVVRDANSLPFIPGTAIAGIIRHALDIKKHDKSIFGFNESKDDKKKRNAGKQRKESIDEGSQIIFSSAYIVKQKGIVIDKLDLNVYEDEYLTHFKDLPIRQHVCIGTSGTSKKTGKFDEEVVYKGTRFCFEIELLSETESRHILENILSELAKESLRIGGGTRKGFGEITIVEYKTKTLNLSIPKELELYINKTSSLNDPFWRDQGIPKETANDDKIDSITLSLNAKDFMLIGSGIGSELADDTPIQENVVIWNDGYPQLKSFFVLPGTSIKGALAHRTDFYYRKEKGICLEDLFISDEKPDIIDSLCESKKELFGSIEDATLPGNVFISDVFIKSSLLEIQPHVVIDAFTGGAVKGKLFQEQLLRISEPIQILIQIKKNNYSLYVREALDKALGDLKNGILPLGAATNRGHGTFKIKNNK
ncbi:MAG: RAMP superfamily CRISPR-associated protein [Rickettsiales bacterium]|jgi:CRISPR/Cas system CSM-associated protein Csm3 (group 7 of RAMP superfamily)|nr:RAMP superfamily CRISPR-associated protein [Rickettsiales bacterium]